MLTELTRVRPGEVRHRDDWSVCFRGRWLVVYELGPDKGEMEIEHGPVSATLYPESFHWTMPTNREATSEERGLITSRVIDAMRFMSISGIEVQAGRA